MQGNRSDKSIGTTVEQKVQIGNWLFRIASDIPVSAQKEKEAQRPAGVRREDITLTFE